VAGKFRHLPGHARYVGWPVLLLSSLFFSPVSAGEPQGQKGSAQNAFPRRYTRLGACIINVAPPVAAPIASQAEPAAAAPIAPPADPVVEERVEPVKSPVPVSVKRKPARRHRSTSVEIIAEPDHKPIDGVPSVDDWKLVESPNLPIEVPDSPVSKRDEPIPALPTLSVSADDSKVNTCEPVPNPVAANTVTEPAVPPVRIERSQPKAAPSLPSERRIAAWSSGFQHGEWSLVSFAAQVAGAVAAIFNWLLLVSLLILLKFPRYAGRLAAMVQPIVAQEFASVRQGAAGGAVAALGGFSSWPPSDQPLTAASSGEPSFPLSLAGAWERNREMLALKNQQAESAILSSIFEQNFEFLGDIAAQPKVV
jgi:hypothetical protein